MLEIFALVIGTITTSLIAITVLAKNSRSITNRLFAGMALSLVLWSVSTYFSLHTSNDQQTLMWMRPIMLFVVLQNSFFFFLVRTFPQNQYNIFKSRFYKFAAVYSAITAIAAASPLLFIDFQDGAPVPGPAMALFLPHALIFAAGGIIHLFVRYFKSRGIEKTQLSYFLAGTVLLYTLVPLGNFVLPVALKTNLFVTLSPLYSIIFAGLFAYGIIAKKLFDIRAAVARSVAYILSLGFIGLIYGSVVFLLSSFFTDGLEINDFERAIYIGLALISAIFFSPVKSYFDRITNKVFFRDAYDPQALIDQLNQTLVANIELNVLLRHASQVLEDNFKSEFCFALVRENQDATIRAIGKLEPKFDAHDLSTLLIELGHSRSKVIVTDDIGLSRIKKVLTENNVAVACRLPSVYGQFEHTEAYLLLGPKKSGNLYNENDTKLLEIIADELMIAIQNAFRFEEIQGFAAKLQQEVNQATTKLKRTNDKLKALDETKDEFISMASHQLRTPLTSVKGYMSMVLEGDAGKLNKQQEQLLNQAFVSSQRMVYLIADLLNVSRLKTGKFVIEAHPTNLADVVEGEISQLKEVAKGKKLKLTFKKPKRFPDLMLDETKIRQVIMNFADNAIYYTPSGGKIDIELKEDKSNIYFSVKDNGLGVPKEEQKHLFGKFYRAKNARKARPDGTGLGLFMAKKVVTAQGGDILFESKESKGSIFGFTFKKDKLAVKK